MTTAASVRNQIWGANAVAFFEDGEIEFHGGCLTGQQGTIWKIGDRIQVSID